MEYLLLVVIAVLALFALVKDWGDYTPRIRFAVLLLTISLPFIQWLITRESIAQHKKDQDRIADLDSQLKSANANVKDLKAQNVRDALRITDKLKEAQETYHRQSDHTLRRITGTAKFLHRKLGGLIPLNGFKFSITLAGIRLGERLAYLPESDRMPRIDFPTPERSTNEAQAKSTGREDMSFLPLARDYSSLHLLPEPARMYQNLMCFGNNDLVQQVALGVQLSDQPIYDVVLAGNSQKKDESSDSGGCEMYAALKVRDEKNILDSSTERTIDWDDLSVETRSRTKDSVTLSGFVSKQVLEAQHLTHWLTMSSFESSVQAQIRLTVDRVISSDVFNKVVNDFRLELPKSLVIEVETGIPEEHDLSLTKHLSLTSVEQSADYGFFYIYFLYREKGLSQPSNANQ
jgi:hypothetical protein